MAALLVKSFEGDIYLAYRDDGIRQTLITNELDRAMTFSSLHQVKDYCLNEGFDSATLQHASAYDEMCGAAMPTAAEMQMDLKWF
ncbi:DUF6482 family protein [Vibrio astriarenae]|uniref:DUF6482 family protein n=1 Tax=Vibrio astriarenae TaxID=1481923 RepID=UPI00373677DA